MVQSTAVGNSLFSTSMESCPNIETIIGPDEAQNSLKVIGYTGIDSQGLSIVVVACISPKGRGQGK